MAKETARALGHEVDVDREKFTYLASTDAEGNKIESGKAAAAGAGAAGAAAAGTAAADAAVTANTDEQNDAATQSDYEPKNHVVTGAEEEHVGTAAEQPICKKSWTRITRTMSPYSMWWARPSKHIGTAPEQPEENAEDDERDDFDDLKDKVTEAGNVVEEAINRAKDFVEDKAQEYQEGSGKKGGFFDRVKDVVREARDNLDESASS